MKLGSPLVALIVLSTQPALAESAAIDGAVSYDSFTRTVDAPARDADASPDVALDEELCWVAPEWR